MALNGVLHAFRCAIAETGLTPPGDVIPDGQIHRFATNGRPDDDAGWYILFGDDSPAGEFGCWRAGIKRTWSARNMTSMTPVELQIHKQRLTQVQNQREEEEARRHAEAATKAAELWQHMLLAPSDHPYLTTKGVLAHDLRVYSGALHIASQSMDGAFVVPLCDASGALCSLEFITKDGDKFFLPGGRKRGCWYVLGKIVDTIGITEGYATGATVHQAIDIPIVIAFDAGNLRPVAEAIRTKYPHSHIFIFGDNDENRTGQNKASEAALAVSGITVIPDGIGDDWNDMHQRDGLDAVRTAILSQVHRAEEITVIPLDDAALPPFPIEAFPERFAP